MAARTTVIAGCTSRKAIEPLPRLHLRSVIADDRLAEWLGRLQEATPVLPPTELYRGEAWRQALALVHDVPAARPYVLSAGYGLVAFDTDIASYSATLSPGHLDSVVGGVSGARSTSEWMSGLLSWRGAHGAGDHASVVEIANARPTEPILVCLGRTYAEAVAGDLRRASEALADPELLSVFSSGAPIEGLDRSWVAVPGNLRLVLGGTLGSTGSRAAAAVVRAIRETRLVASTARAEVVRMSASAPSLPNLRGRRSSDDAVREWIDGYLQHHPASSASRALKMMRGEGLACEQGRFRALFEDGAR
jgi:hypothetical protein